MPVVGVVDIVLGLSVLVWPTRMALASHGRVGPPGRRSCRPRWPARGSRSSWSARATFGVPLALYWRWRRPWGPARAGWPAWRRRCGAIHVGWILRLTSALLLAGHGLLAVSGKPLLVSQLAWAGIGDGGAATLGWVVRMGWFEMALAAAVLLVPLWPLAALACAWKVATELLFPGRRSRLGVRRARRQLRSAPGPGHPGRGRPRSPALIPRG